MPVGTQASVKALSPDDVLATGAKILLANTYHLMLRPGADVLNVVGGLHQFMSWPGAILTDSGGFQVFSLSHRRKVTEHGVTFRSHIDGSQRDMTPESVIDLQLTFGSDIIMPLDELVGFDSTEEQQRHAQEQTHRWLERAVDHFADRVRDSAGAPPYLFGIAQGGFVAALRQESAERIATTEVDGYAIGGLSVGEPKEIMAEMLDASISRLPESGPRYLMGVGSPEDLWLGVAAGVDMFDCVHPTRVARRGALFTLDGRVNITRTRYAQQTGPLDPDCDCYACQHFSAAYLHHLFRTQELLAYRLGSIHNLRFVQRQMEAMQTAIQSGTFYHCMIQFLERYQPADLERAALERQRWTHRRRSRTS